MSADDGWNPPDDRSVRIWTWADAPEDLRALSANGGDEDWLLLAPPDAVGTLSSLIEVLELATQIRWSSVDSYYLHDGSMVMIGANSR